MTNRTNDKSVKDYTNDELRYWLSSKDKKAVEWRTAQANWGLRNEMTQEAWKRQSEAKMGGVLLEQIVEPTHKVRYQEEVESQANQKAAEQATNANAQELKKLVWEQQRSFGMTEDEFERKWPEHLNRLIESGEASKVLDQARAVKRRKSAKTF